MEIIRQMKGPLDAIFVPVGGGGLISGIAAYVKRVRPEVRTFDNIFRFEVQPLTSMFEHYIPSTHPFLFG